MDNVPVLLTSSPYYNFLREYWLGCDDRSISPQKMVCDAAATWRKLHPVERLMFEEPNYIGARLAVDLLLPVTTQYKKTSKQAKSKLKAIKALPSTVRKFKSTHPSKRQSVRVQSKKSKLNKGRST
ncbi:uncharacterized protein LOC115562320 [Drosophila navojoa]|uniref:uncharacterized protein LOC115562320 n=1 Tax=Drosophila navojoa TaxID=7232 RepID=UPI0011BD9CF9|nr:uncharacterized protein LOC115562320 [Drosophila navojoa]